MLLIRWLAIFDWRTGFFGGMRVSGSREEIVKCKNVFNDKAMNNHITILCKLTAVFLFLCFGACNHSTAQNATKLSPEKFHEQLGTTSGAIVIDVRTKREFREDHLSNAINIDVLDDSFEREIAKLDKTKTYFVYCKTGKRSDAAEKAMKEKGFTKLITLDGGIIAWKEQGLPVTR